MGGFSELVNIVFEKETLVQMSETKDKKTAAAATASGNRSKDKKKENHAMPMETSDEEAQTIDTIGKFMNLPTIIIICLSLNFVFYTRYI